MLNRTTLDPETRVLYGDSLQPPPGYVFDAAIATLDSIRRMPGAGSPGLGERCGVPGLRFRRVAGFPCGWFYFVATDHIDVVRLLADAQDLPAILAE